MTSAGSGLFAHFKQQLDRRSEHELLVTADNASWSWGDIDALSARMASALSAHAVSPGDRVTVQVDKSPQSLALYLACLRAGFIYQPLNTAYRAAELEHFVGDAAPAAIVCDEVNRALFESLNSRPAAATIQTLNADGSGSLADMASSTASDFAIVPRHGDDIAALLYSSGTTGVPKGIKLTHDNLLSNAQALVAAWGFGESDRLLHALPIFHVHGLFVALGCVLLSGASMRWLPKFNTTDAVRFLPECTVMMGVPTHYSRLLAEPDFTRETVSSLRLFISGSAPLLNETFRAFEERTGHRILERYGMTETGMNTSNPLDGLRKPGTVGPPLPGVELRICDAAGSALPAGEIGAIEVRGRNVFAAYWRLPGKTADDFTSDGYFRTGDLGCIDADGYVAITGRAKDLIISGGLNVYPKEVEAVIDALPGVAESAVIGVPHPDFGEAVLAVIVRNDSPVGDAVVLSATSVIASCREALAGFKLPKQVCFVAELPRNSMGKVQKNVLRTDYAGAFSGGTLN